MTKSRHPEIPVATMKQYILRRHDDFAACKDAHLSKDFKTLESIAHKIKGNGGTFGFPELSEMGSRLEDGAKNQQLDQIAKALEQFSVWISLHPAE